MLATGNPRLLLVESSYDKFADGQDNIKLGGFTPRNLVRDRPVVVLGSFVSNEATMQLLHTLVVLCESLPSKITLVAPFYPFGTMERVEDEGVVATANTTARLLSNLPMKIELLTFDLHCVTERFFFAGNCICRPVSMVPRLGFLNRYNAIFFPDAGALKRYGKEVKRWFDKIEQPPVGIGCCEKIRRGDERIVRICGDFDPAWKKVLILDDLVRTGGTLRKCAAALRAAGAAKVDGFCVHAAGTEEQLNTFVTAAEKEGTPERLDRLFLTDSVPERTSFLRQFPGVFHIVPIAPFVNRLI